MRPRELGKSQPIWGPATLSLPQVCGHGHRLLIAKYCLSWPVSAKEPVSTRARVPAGGRPGRRAAACGWHSAEPGPVRRPPGPVAPGQDAPCGAVYATRGRRGGGCRPRPRAPQPAPASPVSIDKPVWTQVLTQPVRSLVAVDGAVVLGTYQDSCVLPEDGAATPVAAEPLAEDSPLRLRSEPVMKWPFSVSCDRVWAPARQRCDR